MIIVDLVIWALYINRDHLGIFYTAGENGNSRTEIYFHTSLACPFGLSDRNIYIFMFIHQQGSNTNKQSVNKRHTYMHTYTSTENKYTVDVIASLGRIYVWFICPKIKIS